MSWGWWLLGILTIIILGVFYAYWRAMAEFRLYDKIDGNAAGVRLARHIKDTGDVK